jgi:thiol peroxidase
MAEVTLRGNPVHTVGELPSVGSAAPSFDLVGHALSPVTSDDFAGTTMVLNIFPSLDTATCAASVRAFNERAAGLDDTVVLCISADLPFAQSRFCGAEGIENVTTGSVFRSAFGDDYGVRMVDGPLAGLLARSVVVVGPDGNVRYNELVPEISTEPDYDAALAAAM